MPCGGSGERKVISFHPHYFHIWWEKLMFGVSHFSKRAKQQQKTTNEFPNETSGWKCNNSMYCHLLRWVLRKQKCLFLPFIAITLLASSCRRIKFILSVLSVCQGIRWMPSGWLIVRCAIYVSLFRFTQSSAHGIAVWCLSSHTFLQIQYICDSIYLQSSEFNLI